MRDSSLLRADLRRSLERLEPRRMASAPLFRSGHAGMDRALGGGLACGRMHEIFAAEGDGSSGAGFAALLSLRAATQTGGIDSKRPLLWIRTDGAQKRDGGLHATGLGAMGVDPAALLLALVPDEAALLHAAAEAARCAGLGALLVECRGAIPALDLTASRRLMLAAEASGVTILLLRIAADPTPSAADTRWRAGAASSIALDANAPGFPLFDVELLRRRAGPAAGPWRTEWDRDQLCFKEPDGRSLAGAPLSRPVLPLASGGAAAPLRRAG